MFGPYLPVLMYIVCALDVHAHLNLRPPLSAPNPALSDYRLHPGYGRPCPQRRRVVVLDQVPCRQLQVLRRGVNSNKGPCSRDSPMPALVSGTIFAGCYPRCACRGHLSR